MTTEAEVGHENGCKSKQTTEAQNGPSPTGWLAQYDTKLAQHCTFQACGADWYCLPSGAKCSDDLKQYVKATFRPE